MKRALLLIGLVYAGFFVAPMVAAQDHDVHVRLFALAQFPLLQEELYVRYPSGPTEYKRLTTWLLGKSRDRSPEYFDLVAVVVNLGALPVGSIELQLTRDIKIGELWDFESQPHPREIAQWEGWIPVETKTIGTLDANAATTVWFGPYSADELWENLHRQDLWPWEARYEVTLRCSGCSPAAGLAAFDMSHPH